MESTAVTANGNANNTSKTWYVVYVELILLVVAIIAAVFLALRPVQPSGRAASTSFYASAGGQIQNNLTGALLSPTVSPTIPPVPTPGEPMSAFTAALAAADYRITTAGKVSYTGASPSPTGTASSSAGLSGTNTQSLDLNNGILYMKQGQIVRLEKNDNGEEEYIFEKDDYLYSIDPLKKTYSKMSATNSFGIWLKSILTGSMPMLALAEDTRKGKVKWQHVREHEWQTSWQWQDVLLTQSYPAEIKVTVDPADNLIADMAFRFNTAQGWQTLSYRYEKITNIDTVLVIPAGYVEESVPQSGL